MILAVQPSIVPCTGSELAERRHRKMEQMTRKADSPLGCSRGNPRSHFSQSTPVSACLRIFHAVLFLGLQ